MSYGIIINQKIMDVVDDAEGPLDPRIQIELENLNTATDNINKLEIELDEAHTALGQLWTESTRRLKDISNKLGANCIDRARCYYEALEVSRQARIQCQNQAEAFQRASEIHAAAKETVAVAEARFMSHQHEWNFDQAWQDMLNHATIKVMHAENKKAECGREHHRRATLCHDAEMKVQQLEEKYRKSIIKAEPYFVIRAQYDQMLATQKECVEQLEKAVKHAKSSYSSSFRALEDISNQIHQRRREYDMVATGPREPGVGAELASPEDSLNYEADLNKVSISRLNSLASSSETDTDDRSKDFEDVRDLKKRVDQLDGRSIDGSESVSSQWELELQASMEKLNNLSMKNPQWNSEGKDEIDSVKCQSSVNAKDLHDESQRFVVQNNAKSLKNDVNEYKKLPIEFQILKKFSSSNSSTTLSNDGRQSLTHSPINSIINRSKIAIRNSISKSLSSSPVNMSFAFGRTRNENSSSIRESETRRGHEISIENSIDNRDSITRNSDENVNSCNSANIANSRLKEDNNREVSDESSESKLPKLMESKETEDSKKLKILSEQTQVQKNTEYSSHSVDSTPVRTKIRLTRTSRKPLNQENESKLSSKTSSVRELPLLSLFEAKSLISKDKSCSMINLAEKHNLKTLLDNPNLRNIQAVSVERLASARNNIMGEHLEARKSSNK